MKTEFPDVLVGLVADFMILEPLPWIKACHAHVQA
jgi:hypothetical protein